MPRSSSSPARPARPRKVSPPAPRKGLTVDMLERAIWDAYGVVTAAAEAAGIDRRSLTRRISKSVRLQAAVSAARDRLIDKAESKLATAIERGDPWAITLALKTLGKSRGYVERQELDALFAMLDKDPADMTDDELDEALARVTSRRRG